MARVIHTGDTHLGYRQYHRPERRADFLAAFRRVIEDAVDAGVDAVVHAGDLFHDRHPDLQDLMGALSVLRDLDSAGIPFLAVVGNHETKRDAQWLDLYASLGLATRLGTEPVVVADTAFYGLDYVPRSRRDDLDYDFADHDANHAALVAHGLFDPIAPDYGGTSDHWDARTVLDEASVAFDALLLGDEHTPTREQLDCGTWATYPGSTERVSADERADRGYNIVQFDAGDGAEETPVHLSRRSIPTRDFVFVDVELADGEGLSRLQERVGQHELEDAVAVVRIDGDGEEIAPAHVEEYIQEAGALVARVTDRREATTDKEIEVSFADPDEAVRERVRDLGLSQGAREIDETVRESAIARTTIADTVEERVREIVENGETEIFESAPPEPGAPAGAPGSGGADNGSGSNGQRQQEAAGGDDADGGSAASEGAAGEGHVSLEEYL